VVYDGQEIFATKKALEVRLSTLFKEGIQNSAS